MKWLSSIKTSLSPKAWLAKRIAQILNEYFVLDNEDVSGELTPEGTSSTTSTGSFIESNLLADAKIVLRNVQVRPRRLHEHGVRLSGGTVTEIQFSWKWTKSAKKSFVKDAKLEIRGAQFRIAVGEKDQNQDPVQVLRPEPQDSSNTPNQQQQALPTDGMPSYIQKQIQQIIDHLEIDISNVQLVVELMQDRKAKRGGSGLLLQAKRFHLAPVLVPEEQDNNSKKKPRGSITRVMKSKRNSSNASTSSTGSRLKAPLAHRISLESISARILMDATAYAYAEDASSLPLVDPFSYAVTVTRVSGRHMLDGWETGLKIAGEIVENESESGSIAAEVVLHAGETQAATLSQLAYYVQSAILTAAAEEEKSTAVTIRLNASGTAPAPKAPVSSMELAIPSIVVFTPNGGSMVLPTCCFTVFADASVCHLRGTDGVVVEQKPIVVFQEGADSSGSKCHGEWVVDLANQNVLVRSTSKGSSTTTTSKKTEATEPTTVALIRWDDSVMKQLVGEIRSLEHALDLPRFARKLPRADEAPQQPAKKGGKKQGTTAASPSSDLKWEFTCSGTVLVNVSCQQDWLIAKVGSPSLQISTTTTANAAPRLTNLRFDGIDIGPTSFGKSTALTKFHIPPMKLQGGWSQGTITADGQVRGVIESIQVADKLLKFGKTLLGVFQKQQGPKSAETLGQDSRGAHGDSTLYLRVPGASIRIASLDAELVAEAIIMRSPFHQVGCRRLSINDARGSTLAVAGVKASIYPEFCVKVNNIDLLSLAGIGAIEHPVVNQVTKVARKGGQLHIETPPLHFKLSDGTTSRHNSNNKMQSKVVTEFVNLPFPIHCSCPGIVVQQSLLGGITTDISKLELHLVPFDSSATTRSVACQVLVHSLENKFVRLDTTGVSGVLKGNDASAIHQFSLTTEPVEVRASPTSLDLRTMFDGDGKGSSAFPTTLRLPHANVASVVVNLRWKGLVVGTKRTTSTMPAFQGNSQTTIKDLIKHYKKPLLEQVAATITDNKILPPKANKMTGKAAGKVLVGSEAVVGNVRDAIATGKKSRNAKPGAKYKFGDFARGAIHTAVDNIKKTEAEIRRSSEKLAADSINWRAFQI